MLVKVQVNCSFYVTCPECGRANKFEPIMSQCGDDLYAHFLKVIQDESRNGLPEITCDECGASFKPWSFTLPRALP